VDEGCKVENNVFVRTQAFLELLEVSLLFFKALSSHLLVVEHFSRNPSTLINSSVRDQVNVSTCFHPQNGHPARMDTFGEQHTRALMPIG
jgi:hypothetical protein